MKTVVAKNASAPARTLSLPSKPVVLQRKCACSQSASSGGECSECRKKKLQRRAESTPASVQHLAPPIVREVLQSPGQSLDVSTRGFMEARFGHDFSKVRVHSDAHASASARAVDAHAYTVGSHVVFGAGQYSPESEPGKSLLAHELTHVLQQRQIEDFALGESLIIAPPHDQFEQEADALVRSMAGKHPIPALSFARASSELQRFALAEFLSQIPILGPFLSGRAFGAENYTREEILRYYTDFVA